MFLLYNLVFYLVLPFILLRVLLRGFKNRGYWQRLPQRFGVFNAKKPIDIWIHAVSVGEVRAAAPLINRLLDQQLVGHILITTMTPTGSQTVQQMYADNQRVEHCFIPYDLPDTMRRFMSSVNPRRVIVLETELWPNLIQLCQRRGIRLDYVNVRISEKSFIGYSRFKNWVSGLLGMINSFAVQTEADAQYLYKLGVSKEKITVTGNIKFDIKLPPSLIEVAQVLRRQLGVDRPVWVAGSTHEGEDELVLEVHQRLQQQFPGLLLILVPRHPERFASVARLLKTGGVRYQKRSEPVATVTSEVSVYLGDTLGELNLFYAAADIAFVGGSLLATGGHNVLEPCALGLPVVFGRHMFHFNEISELVLAAEAGAQVVDADGLERVVSSWLADHSLRNRVGDNGRQLISDNRGALDRTLAVLEK